MSEEIRWRALEEQTEAAFLQELKDNPDLEIKVVTPERNAL